MVLERAHPYRRTVERVKAAQWAIVAELATLEFLKTVLPAEIADLPANKRIGETLSCLSTCRAVLFPYR